MCAIMTGSSLSRRKEWKDQEITLRASDTASARDVETNERQGFDNVWNNYFHSDAGNSSI